MHFNLWTLLIRRDLSALSSVRVDGLHASIDLRDGRAATDAPAPNAVWPMAPESFPAIEARDISLDMHLSTGLQIELQQVQIASRGTAALRELAIEAAVARFTQADQTWKGPANLELSLSSEQLSITELDIGSRRLLERTTLDWSRLSRRELGWNATLANGQVQSEGTLSAGQLAGSLQADQADVAQWADLLPADLSSLAARVDAQADFALALDEPSALRASLRMAASQIGFQGSAADSLTCNARVEGGVLHVDELQVAQADVNRVRIEDLEVPVQAGDLRRTLRAMRGTLSFDLRDLSLLPIGAGAGLPEHHLDGRGRIENGRIQLDDGTLVVPGGNIQIDRAAIDLRPSDLARRAVEVEATVAIADLGQLARLWGSDDSGGSLSGRLSLGGMLAEPTGDISFTGHGVRLASLPLGELEIRAHAADSFVQLEELRCVGDLGTVDAAGGYRIRTGELDSVTLDVELHDLAALGLADDLGFQLGAPASLRANLNGVWTRLSGDVELNAPATNVRGHALESLQLQAQLIDGSAHVTNLELDSPWAKLQASGSAALGTGAGAPIAITLDTLALERDASRLELAQPVALRVDAGALEIEIEPLRMSGSAGSLTLEGHRRDGDILATAVAEALDLSQFLAPLSVSPGGIDARLALELKGGELQLESAGSVARFSRVEPYDLLSARWSVALADGILKVDQLQLEEQGVSLTSLTAQLPFDPMTMTLAQAGNVRIDGTVNIPTNWAGRVPLPEELGTLAGSVRSEIHVAGLCNDVRGTFSCNATDVQLDGASVAHCFEAPARIDLALQFEDSVAATLATDLPGLAQIDGSGRILAGLDLGRFFEDSAAAVADWRAAALDGQARLEIEDLARLTRPLEAIRRLEGRLVANLKVAGSFGDPQLDGDATLDEGALRLNSEMPTLEHLNAKLHFDGRSAQLVDVRAELGAAPVVLGGDVDWSERPLQLDLRIQGEELLLLRTPSARLRADTDLRLSGTTDQLHLEGKLGLRASRILHQIDLMPRISGLAAGGAVRANSRGFQFFSLRSPALANMSLDLDIDTVDPVRLTTNVASSSWAVHLRIQGTGGVPLPEGEILMTDTRLKLPAGVMTFESGRVLFSQENPFIPTLELRGETRLAGYDVSMQVTGPYDRPEAQLSSSPPLADASVLILILTGTPPADGERSSSERAAQSITLYLAKDLLQRIGSQSLDDNSESLLDRLEIIQGREVSKSGTETTEASLRMRDGIWSDRDAFYLVGERDLYEEYNLGLRIVFRLE
ncbi:MAG: hypothetical protein ACI8QZ_003006 [Chlamydiales bacterium]